MFKCIHRASVCFLVVLGLSACGGGGGGSKPVAVSSAPVTSVASSLSSGANTSSVSSSVASSAFTSISTSSAAAAIPATIEVTSTTVLLTAPNQTQALKARVLDEKGNEIAAAVTWESTNPTGILVDSNGVVTAGITDASAQITASIGTLKSIPLMVAYTQIANGALLLTDAQIVGDPVETDPTAAFDVNNTYSIKLSGVAAPSVGQVVVNSGNKPVVGRVKAVSTLGNVHTVILAMVSVKEALPNLHIKESFDLRNLPVQIPAAVLAEYDVVREGSSFTYTPKAAASANTKPHVLQKTSGNANPASALASGEIGKSIQCEFTIEGIAGKGSPPIQLSKLPSLKVDFNPDMNLEYNPIDGLKELVLSAKPTITIDSTFEFDASIDPKLTCTLELETFVAPVGGPFAALLGPSVTFYGGIEVSTKTSLKGVTLGAVATISNTLDVGIRNCGFMGCSAVSEATLPKADVKTVMSELAESYRFEPSVFVYGMAKVGIANPLLKSLRVEAVYAKLGPALNASLARPDGQIIDPAYVSNYSIDAQLKAGLDTVFKEAAFFFGINGLTENLIDLKWPIAQSPTGKATADVSSFKAGDKVNIDIKLDPENLMFLGFYNVKRVVVLRKTGSAAAVEVASSTPNVDGASTFKLSYTAQSDGQSSELYAFVQTNDTILASLLNGLPLEIGQVNAYVAERGRLMSYMNINCALSNSGDFQCWGETDGYHYLSPTSLADFGTGLKAVTHNPCAITQDGGVKCFFDGSQSAPKIVEGLTNIEKIAMAPGEQGVCGVNTSKQLWCAYAAENEAFHVTGLPNVVDISSMGYLLVKTETGTAIAFVKAFIANKIERYAPIPEVHDVLSMSTNSVGNGFPCVVKTSGEVQCLNWWGNEPFWETITGTPKDTIVFENTSETSCALTRSGSISCTGMVDVMTQRIEVFSPGCSGNVVEKVELDSLVKAANLKNIIDISLMENGMCAINNKSEVTCVGDNRYGQLGYITTYPTPDGSNCGI